MKAAVYWLCLAGAILLAGCATPAQPVVVDSSAATVPASAEQLLLGKHRGALIYGRWSEEKRTKFLKSGKPQLAVKTLGLTPEQAVSLGARIPSPGTAICVMIWDAKAEQVVGTECHVLVTPPELGSTARFGSQSALYVGSL